SPGRRTRGPRHHRPGHRRSGRRCRPCAARARAAPRQPRVLLHVAARRRGRVPRERWPFRRRDRPDPSHRGDRSDRAGARHPAGTDLEGDPPMSTLTVPAPAPSADAPARAHQVTFPRVLHSEWIKFWSLRSTVWTVAATVVVMAAVRWLAVFFPAKEAPAPSTKPQDAAELTRLLHDPSLILTGTEL